MTINFNRGIDETVEQQVAKALIMMWASVPPVAPSLGADIEDLDEAWYGRIKSFMLGMVTGIMLTQDHATLANEVPGLWDEVFNQEASEKSRALLAELVDGMMREVTGGDKKDEA